jgi:hypothetical protein
MNPNETPQEIIHRYHTKINPTQLADGHCALCAFNAYLGLRGYPLMAAQLPRADFKPFGDWFYKKYTGKKLTLIATVNNGNDTNLAHFEQIVSDAIKQHTSVGDAVLICLDDGVHWYVALNTNTDIVYIDAQQGRGFNSHISTLTSDTQIEILSIPDKVIDEYFSNIFAGTTTKKNGITKKHRKRKRKRRGTRRVNLFNLL